MEYHGGTVLRIKRKRNEEPLDALLVAAAAVPHAPAAEASHRAKQRGGLRGLSLNDD